MDDHVTFSDADVLLPFLSVTILACIGSGVHGRSNDWGPLGGETEIYRTKQQAI